MKIKNRVIISVILTVLFLFTSVGVWLVTKPLQVGLNLSGDAQKANIAVIFNRKNNNEFHKVRKADKLIYISKNTKVNFNIYIYIARRFRIDFSNLKNKSPIIINEILFNNGKIKVTDLDKFVLQGGELKISDNNLIIYPKEDNCRLLYDKKLFLLPDFAIEYEVFLIILILSFLLSYKAMDYIANFKSIQHKSRIEIIFLVFFFVILFLPMSNIDRSYLSQKENRTLAEWKPLLDSNSKLNFNFGQDVNNYFSDRFFLRNVLIKIYYNQFIINKNLRTKKVIKGKENWLFHGVISAINMYKKENLFSDENLKDVAKLLSDYDKYCKKNGKKFYFYIAPSKSMIYDEFYSEVITPSKDKTTSLAFQLTNYLKENTDVKVVYPYYELRKNKDKDLLYWKTDTHWNEHGAYIGYQVLMDEINKDLNLKRFNVSKYVEVQEQSGDLNKNLPKSLRIKEFSKYKKPYVSENDYFCQKTQSATDIQNCTGHLNNKTLLVIRDSFTINLIPYLASTFKKSKYIWQDTVDFNLMPEADVVIFEIVEVSLPRLIGERAEL